MPDDAHSKLLDRVNAFFTGPFMKTSQDVVVTTTGDVTGIIDEKTTTVMWITNVDENYKHIAIVVPDLGFEWQYYSKGGLKQWIEAAEGVRVWWKDPKLDISGSSDSCLLSRVTPDS